jgi:hypothetical protein
MLVRVGKGGKSEQAHLVKCDQIEVHFGIK